MLDRVKIGRWISLLFLAAGLAFFGVLVYTLDAGAIWRELSRAGVYFPIIALPYLLSYGFSTVGWRYSFPARPPVSLNRLYWIRLIGETMNTITPAAYFGGEPVKVLLLERHGVKPMDGVSSVVVAKTVITISEAVFVLIGIIIAITQIGTGPPLIKALMWAMVAFIVVCVLLLTFQRMGMFGAIVRFLGRLGMRGQWFNRLEHWMKRLDASLYRYYRENPRGLALGILFHFLGWVVGVVETYIILHLLGIPADWGMAFAIESIGAMIKGAMFFIPGGLGASEGGNVLIFAAYGLSGPTALSYSILRRFREIFFIAIGLLLFSRSELSVMRGFSTEGAELQPE